MATKDTLKDPDDAAVVPVETLRIDVLQGPDEGASSEQTEDTLSIGTAQGNALVLSDPTVSRYHVELVRGDEGVLVRDQGSTNGTFIGNVRIHEAVVPVGIEFRIGRSTLQVNAGETVHLAISEDDHIGELHGQSEQMRRLMAQVQRIAQTDAAVLVVGESGTGKELIARAIHDHGARADQAFITVDCAALAPNLVASELFGHERGAFTGADRRHIGAFERANGGTIFLDEVGELPQELQATLLGALERKRFHRVGGNEDISVDVRVVAATNRELRSEVNAGRFRLDLYYRLAVVSISVPPLRDRPADILFLAQHFLKQCGHRGAVHEVFGPEAAERLLIHRWPGNARELRNVVEATLAMGELPALAEGLAHDDADDDRLAISLPRVLPLAYKQARASVLDEFEKQYLDYWLQRTDGNVAKAAREAQMDRSHLFHLLRRHNLR